MHTCKLTGEGVFSGQRLLVGEKQRLVRGVERRRTEGGGRSVHPDRLKNSHESDIFNS